MTKFGVGQPVRRTEDPRFLTGQATFVDDINLPRQTRGYVLRSPMAHARIASIDTAAAEAAPGVFAVLTGDDYAADGLGGLPCVSLPEAFIAEPPFRPPNPALVRDRVRRVGDPVAFVIAETLEQAKDAAELIAIDYDALPSVTTIDDALAPESPAVWDEAPGNVAFLMEMGDKAETDAAFEKAHHVTRLTLRNNRVSANPMEQRGAIGDYRGADDRFTIYTSTQVPFRVRQILAQAVFRMPETRLHAVARDVGGGFGLKGGVYAEEVLVLWASRRVGRPVKWIAERGESFISDSHGRDQLCEAEMAFDENAKITGFRVANNQNLGAQLATGIGFPALLSSTLLSGVYAIPAIHCTMKGVFTNTPPVSPYRGAGRPEAAYIVESVVNAAAAEMGIDPVELRRRNYIQPSEMPYKTALVLSYDCGEFEAATDVGLEIADWDGFGSRRADAERRGKLRGRGLSYYVEVAASGIERMELRFDASGNVTIVSGTMSHGQGHETAYAQMVSDWLGMPFEDIRFIQGDTDQVSFGRGTSGSRSITLGGSALRVAADEIIEKGKRIAANVLEAAEDDIEFADGAFTVAGTDRSLSLTDAAKRTFMARGLPADLRFGLEATGNYAAPSPNFPNGGHFVEVEIDPESGIVEIVDFAAVDDIGRPINPMMLHGQVHGGIVQGIGQAIRENIVFDAGSGQLLSGSFLDYAMPRADDVPFIKVAMHDVPTKTNPLGVKGAGEAGAVGAPPAVMHAILDALAPYGVTHLDMPATPEKVWRAIRGRV